LNAKNPGKTKSFCLFILKFLFFCQSAAFGQTYVFARLQGAPVNLANWNLQGSAKLANIKNNNLSEILLAPAQYTTSGAVFYNRPINLGICNKWIAEFDFRMFDGDSADGLAFCFLDVPPVGFVTGGGLGIPATANGLKVCFDTYQNCGPVTPKIEIRWGDGYDECAPQPTLDNTTGILSFIRSDNYNHAKIVYDSGNISVYVNGTLYLTGAQQFNFTGYMGFTASTGGFDDNHSIKNVTIYTNVPPSVAGAAQTICSGSSAQLGASPDPANAYFWTPANGLSATNIANPVVSLVNTTNAVITQKYYVQTAFANSTGCTSIDSVLVSVNPYPKVNITASADHICAGTTVSFTAATPNQPATYQWYRNTIKTGVTTATYSDNSFTNGDQISCNVTSLTCSTMSNVITLSVMANQQSAVSIAVSQNTVCAGTPVTFTATPTNGGSAPAYQWTVNGNNAGTNAPTFTSTTLANNDVVGCTMTSSAACIVPAATASNKITMIVNALVIPSVSISGSANNICAGTPVTFTAIAAGGGNAPIYQWLVNGNNAGTNSATFTSSSLANGDAVTCMLTSNAVCATPATVASNSVTMNINALITPAITISATATAICAGTPVTFTAAPSGGGNTPMYQWQVNGSNAGTNNATFTSNTLNSGDVVSCVLTSNADCATPVTASSPGITMTVNAPVPASVSITASTTNACQRIPVTFTAVPTGGGISPVYQWLVNGTGAGSNSSTYTDSTLSSTDAVTCMMTSSLPCAVPVSAVSNSISLTIYPAPIVAAGGNKTINQGSSIALNGTAGGNIADITWSPATGLSNSKVLNPVASPYTTTTYTLTVQTTDGCVGIDSAKVIVLVQITVPNTFTPNGDGVNDLWDIKNLGEYQNSLVKIFDRYGQQVYQSLGVYKPWDGKLNGSRLPVGTYYYIINLNDGSKPMAGYVLILR
jgi:gliding motility-associated-like protein